MNLIFPMNEEFTREIEQKTCHNGESSKRIHEDFYYVIKVAEESTYANFWLFTNFF